MLPEKMTGDWWSEFFHKLSTEDAWASEHVIVAETGNRGNAQSSRQRYTALMAPDLVTAALKQPGRPGYRVDTSGPHPSPVLSEPERTYRPTFWIWAGEVAPDGLEPLVVAWTSGNHTTLAADQGFLMTYGLVPRNVSHRDTFTMHWDDPPTLPSKRLSKRSRHWGWLLISDEEPRLDTPCRGLSDPAAL
jgi:hypothetical protein